jgi:Zn-dependent M28 family amino/carboxypeptidase
VFAVQSRITARMRPISVVLPCVVAAVLAACGSKAPSPDALARQADTAAGLITADYLRDAVTALSSDELQGRAPATPGDARTRAMLIDRLRSMGYEPGGPNGGWEQPFDIVGITTTAPEGWRFLGKDGAIELKSREDFVAVSGVQAPAASIRNAEVVFVGYGIEAPEYQWDDFKGVDVKGKVLLMLNNDPDWDPKLFDGVRRLYYGRWTYKYEIAARRGAAGAIIIHTTPSAGYPWQVVQSSWSGEQFELPADDQPRVQVQGWTTEEAARRLAATGGHDLAQLIASARSREFVPVALRVRTSLALSNTLTRSQTANVAGLLPGGDPTLRREAVVFTAHHDHLGVGEPDATGDRIYNGARDNAAGSAQVLAIARAFASLETRPRRSLLMLFVAAEEQGLLGSQYFARAPTFPPGRIAANINFDGGNIWGRTSDVTVIGFGKSSIDDVARQATARQGRKLLPDQFPDRGSYYRSDQFSFARIGVPALYYGTGTQFVGRPAEWGRQQIEQWEERQYHQPSDEITPEWNFDGMVDDARLGFHSGVALASADAMPVWNRGDEFEAARKAAIAAIPAGR